MRALAVTLALIFACTSLAFAADPVPVALCPQVDDAPAIDGSLEDTAWEQAEALRPFERHDGTGLATEQTDAFLCSDGETLFIGCVLHESAMDNLAAEETAYDDSAIFRQDVVEFFIQPDLDQEQYFHLAASVAGSRRDAIATGGAQDWNAQWQAATSLGDDRWTLEVAIPLAEVDLAGIEAGQAIGLNICREEKPRDELSCWSPTLGPFHNQSRFGEVIFFSIEPLAAQRIASADEAVQSAADADADAAADLEARLGALREGLAGQIDGATWADAREQLTALRDDAERIALAGREAIVWQVNPWALPAHTELPGRDVSEVEQVTVRLMQDEYETVAIGIANPGEESLAYHVSATDLLRWEASEEIPVEDRIQLREAVSLKTRTGGMVRDALPGLGPASRLVVPGGQNAVLWLTVHARDLEPGRYLAGIDLLPMVGEQRRNVRLSIQVHPTQMTKDGPPWLNTWAYLRRAEDFGWEEKGAEDLREHYCNVYLIQYNDFPWPTVDDEGNIVEPLEFSTMDARIELVPDGFYLLSPAMHWNADLNTDLEPWSPEHKRALGQWAIAIRDHLAELGIDR
ncbi:MAG: sugar-binding protein, partial [Armatimonadota bacterium]